MIVYVSLDMWEEQRPCQLTSRCLWWVVFTKAPGQSGLTIVRFKKNVLHAFGSYTPPRQCCAV